MYEPSFMSSNTIATYARKIAHHGRPDVDITLDQYNVKPITYTTGDSLSGQVAITAPHTVRFDEVLITFEGLTLTRVENMSPVAGPHSRIEARHPFLRLVMPIPETDYPQPRIAEAGQTYRFPFNFVIPEHLLLNACKHPVAGDHVHESHLRLPPSMGDREMSPSDDFSPDMARIQYTIRVKVTRTREQDGRVVVLTDRSRKIRVIPAIPEAPPMHIPSDDKDYIMSITKGLRKGMFAGKLGKITVSAPQTKALAVPSNSTASPTIMATLKLRFDPSTDNAKPPRLGSLSSKIKSSTFFAARPLKDLATRGSMVMNYDVLRGIYTTTIPLASRSVESVNWTYHTPPNFRRDSGYSTCSSESSSSEVTVTPTKGWYEAQIPLPLTLPACKTWLPSFHSCLISRVYTLEMNLNVHTPGAGVPASTFALRMPVQISSQPDEPPVRATAAATADIHDNELDDYLRPRVLQVPGEAYTMSSVLHSQRRVSAMGAMDAPPGYEPLHTPRWGMVPDQMRRQSV